MRRLLCKLSLSFRMMPSFLAKVIQAEFVFSDVSYASNSVTFTINGNMTRYTDAYDDNPFSIRCEGNFWVEPNAFYANFWSTSVLDDEKFGFNGNGET